MTAILRNILILALYLLVLSPFFAAGLKIYYSCRLNYERDRILLHSEILGEIGKQMTELLEKKKEKENGKNQ